MIILAFLLGVVVVDDLITSMVLRNVIKRLQFRETIIRRGNDSLLSEKDERYQRIIDHKESVIKKLKGGVK